MRIGILTGGGDCPGLNAVLRAAARAVEVDHGGEVVGFHDGWRGVLEDRWEPLTVDRCRGILPRGGTILGTSRDQPYQQADGPTLVGEAIDRHGLDAIVAIGGEGTMGVVTDLDRDGLPVVGVPKTIDNDIAATEMTFGFDTAVHVCTAAIDRLQLKGRRRPRLIVSGLYQRPAGDYPMPYIFPTMRSEEIGSAIGRLLAAQATDPKTTPSQIVIPVELAEG